APAATSLLAPTMASLRSGHSLTRSLATPAALSASREPSVTRLPDEASRTAIPRPAGPVPPRIPTCIPLLSHNLRNSMGLLDGKRLLITGVLTDASLAFAVAK